MAHLGDYDAGTVIYGKFSTYRPSTGATFTLGGTPALSVYKDNSTTQSTTGVTLTADFDSVTGLNHFAIDTSADGAFYAAGSNFDVVITTGTVDGVSVTGSVVASFSLRKSSSLKPTVAGRTLDVSAGGEAGIDWANIGSPTTAQNLSATNIDVDQVVASVSGAVGSVTGAVGSVGAGGITAASLADGAIDRATFAADTGLQTIRSSTAQAGAAGTITLDASASASDDFYNDTDIYLTGGTGAGQLRHISDYVGATKVATIKPAWTTAPDATTTFAIRPAASPWDHVLADHLDSGSPGATVNSIQADTDDIQTRLPAALIGGRMDANVGAISGDAIAADNLEAALDGTGGVTITAALTGNVTGNLSGSVGSVTGAVGSVAAGGIAATSFAAGAIDAAAIAANAIGASEIAADALAAIADAVADEAFDGAITLRQSIRLHNSALGGKASGLATTSAVYRDLADTMDRITATVDADGNRTVVTRNLT